MDWIFTWCQWVDDEIVHGIAACLVRALMLEMCDSTVTVRWSLPAIDLENVPPSEETCAIANLRRCTDEATEIVVWTEDRHLQCVEMKWWVFNSIAFQHDLHQLDYVS